MDERRTYPSDLTDGPWALVEPFGVRPRRADGRGRPTDVNVREVVHAVRSVLRDGCRWRSLAHDLTSWHPV